MITIPLTTKAKTVNQDKVEVEIGLIGSDHHFVYKIPKHLHKDMPYTEMKNGIQASLANHWKIERLVTRPINPMLPIPSIFRIYFKKSRMVS